MASTSGIDDDNATLLTNFTSAMKQVAYNVTGHQVADNIEKNFTTVDPVVEFWE